MMFFPLQGCSGGGERCWTHPWLTCVEKRTWPGGGPEETVWSWSTNGSWRKWSSCMRWVFKIPDSTRLSRLYPTDHKYTHHTRVNHPGGENPPPAAAEGETGWHQPSSLHQIPEWAAVTQHELGDPVHLHIHLLPDLQHHLWKCHHPQREQRLRLNGHREPGGSWEGAGHKGESGATDGDDSGWAAAPSHHDWLPAVNWSVTSLCCCSACASWHTPSTVNTTKWSTASATARWAVTCLVRLCCYFAQQGWFKNAQIILVMCKKVGRFHLAALAFCRSDERFVQRV